MSIVTHKGKVASTTDARRFWHLHNRRQYGIEKMFALRISKAIHNQYKSFLDAISERGYQYAKNNLFTLISTDEVTRVIKDLYQRSAFVEANYVLSYMRRKKKDAKGGIVYKHYSFETKRVGPKRLGLGFDELAPVIDDYFQIHLLNKVSFPITRTTRKIIFKHIIEQVDRGIPLAKVLQDFNDLALTGGAVRATRRAIMIAKTESTRSMSFGGLIGAYMTGIDIDKVWVTSEDEMVRGYPNYPAPFSHVSLDMDIADARGSFYNGEAIKFPGDPDASIENIANCRCAMFFKEKEDPEEVVEDRRLSNFLIDMFSGLLAGVGLAILNDQNDTSEN